MNSYSAIIRIEHKLDALISYLKAKDPSFTISPVGAGAICPVCGVPSRNVMSLTNSSVSRSCGCVVPQVMDLFTAPGDAKQVTTNSGDEHVE